MERQAIAVSDSLADLINRQYPDLTRETGIRLHYNVSWARLPNAKHYRDKDIGEEVWVFESKGDSDGKGKEDQEAKGKALSGTTKAPGNGI